MSATVPLTLPRARRRRGGRLALVLLAVGFLAVVLLLPLVVVFAEALRQGFAAYLAALAQPAAGAAIRLSLAVAAIAVPLNLVFGLAAAWAMTRHRFPGRALLGALIDLPFSVSPVVSGLVYVLLFGAQGWLGAWLAAHELKILFALPGLVLATVFVTLPFVARELIPLMEAQGSEEEEAALTLGASGRQIFLRVTLPKVRWALLYGVLLCTARALGEFGAVSVVSGHVPGRTNTLPLHIEALYSEYDYVGAFAVATLLAAFGLVTLALKTLLEWRHGAELAPRAARATAAIRSPA